MNLILFDRKESVVSAKVISFSKFPFLHTVFGVKFNKVIQNYPSYMTSTLKLGLFVNVTLPKAGRVQTTLSHVRLSLICYNRIPMDKRETVVLNNEIQIKRKNHFSKGSINSTKMVFYFRFQFTISISIWWTKKHQKYENILFQYMLPVALTESCNYIFFSHRHCQLYRECRKIIVQFGEHYEVDIP